MKKIYNAPLTVELQLAVSPVMTTVSQEQTTAGVGNGMVGNNTPDLSDKTSVANGVAYGNSL